MYPEKIIALMALKTAVDADPRGKNIWADLHRMRMTRLVNRIGPKKLKSLPFLAAQKVYPVKAETTADVKIRASSTIAPETSHIQMIGKRVLTEEGEENKEEENARTSLESLIEGSIENSDTGDESGEEDLSGDNSVDFADEAPAQLVLAETNSRVQSPLLDIAFHSAIVAAAHTLEAQELRPQAWVPTVSGNGLAVAGNRTAFEKLECGLVEKASWAWAALKGIQVAQHLGLKGLFVESDSEVLGHYLDNARSPTITAHHILEACKKELEYLETCKYQIAAKKAHKIANALARLAYGFPIGMHIKGKDPDLVMVLLEVDIAGIISLLFPNGPF
nr:RING-H2 finger protein ATL67-like [Ipomoea batatas]